MPKQIIIFISILAAFFVIETTQADSVKTYDISDSIIVTASKSPISIIDIARNVEIITSDMIKLFPVSSVDELLSYALSVDIRSRAGNGVQSDLSIRGGTFEQTLIMINGVKISDQQTGHHNLNIPVNIQDIGKIEILKGAASKLYGPQAMNGVVNIITKNIRKNKGAISIIAGTHEYSEAYLSYNMHHENSTHTISYGKKNSNGFQENTEFDITNITLQNQFMFQFARLDIYSGYQRKEFGAFKFYSNNFPNEKEKTETGFIHSQLSTTYGNVSIKSGLSWRRHADEFILNNSNPLWYLNEHLTDVLTGNIESQIPTGFGTIVVGAEISHDKINTDNTRLDSFGNPVVTPREESKTNSSYFVETKIKISQSFSIVPGALYHSSSKFSNKLYPGLDIGFHANENLFLYASAGKSFRNPSYTELYNQDPANQGDLTLKSEKSWSYEGGARLQNNIFKTSFSYFIRESENLIDWGRNDTSDIWVVENISDVTTKGIELSTQIQLDKIIPSRLLQQLQVNFTNLSSKHTSKTTFSKYVLTHYDNKLNIGIGGQFSKKIHHQWNINYIDRADDSYWLVDSKISMSLNNLVLFINIQNLLGYEYYDLGSIPKPGRWIKFGIEQTF